MSVTAFALLINICISIFFTMMAISTYIFLRFAYLLRTKGLDGITQWAAEIADHIYDTRSELLERVRNRWPSESSVVVVEKPSPPVSARDLREDGELVKAEQ